MARKDQNGEATFIKQRNLMQDAIDSNYQLLIRELPKKNWSKIEGLMKQCFDLGEYVGITKVKINKNKQRDYLSGGKYYERD